MKNLITRAISGAVYVALIIGAIFIGEVAFLPLFTIFALFAMIEFQKITHLGNNVDSGSDLARFADAVAVVLVALCPAAYFWMQWGGLMVALLAILSIYFIVRATICVADKGVNAYREAMKSVFSVIYIGLPILMLNLLYIFEGEESKMVVLAMFILIWLNDTGAYCFGCTLGKNRLCERLSPKKSWEGFWGGMLCCVVFGAVCGWFFDFRLLGVIEWVVLGAAVSAAATIGDLFESMLKRNVNVKDSGSIMPGHGGILDRIDSLLFVAPLYAIIYIALSLLK